MMILDALVHQLNQRFHHEKRARVCLWFDERREFSRLLTALRAHLSAMKQPPFILLEYDETKEQGQIWLKYQIFRKTEDACPRDRKNLRFILYLPISEDRLDGPGLNGESPIELLVEYKIAGITWRINGKRPTLFTFLRQAGVSLPDNPSDQRKLYDRGQDSLLAKYVAKFADRPAAYWGTTLSPELAQSRLIGDIDQTILDLAVDPETTWQVLKKRGLSGEFLDIVSERYGFVGPIDSLSEWIREFVAALALTETYVGYGEPNDFPFSERLPPIPLRQHHSQLLQRWLRDTESRTAWDRWVGEVESRIDLAPWAKSRQGLSFSFPHLVKLRWEEVRGAFEKAAEKTSTTEAFFKQYSQIITKEAEYTKASYIPIGSWRLIKMLENFLCACREALSWIKRAKSIAELVHIYVDAAPNVERKHIQIRYEAEEQNLPTVSNVADRAYAEYANSLNASFFKRLVAISSIEIPDLPIVTGRLEEAIWHGSSRRAVIIADSFRYDCACAIKELLREHQVAIEPVAALLPTVTAIGMTALMPLFNAEISVEITGNNIHPKVNGKDMFVRANRVAYLKEFGADCREIGTLESVSDPPNGLGTLLVVFGHDEVDHIGHGNAQTLVRHMHLEVERVARLIRKLHRWGYPQVHVVTDHGFILLDEEQLPQEVPCNKEWCHVRKERFALVPSGVDLPLATFPFAWDDLMRVAVPPGLSFFKAEKSFSHGGAAIQELVIPYLVSKSEVTKEKRIGVEVVLPAYELMQTTAKLILRTKSEAVKGQMSLFETGRTLMIDVLRVTGNLESVLASGPKEVRLEPNEKEQSITLFFHTAASFQKGELLDLDIRDIETAEQFPPGGIKLTAGREM
jgi:hypothetical protein